MKKIKILTAAALTFAIVSQSSIAFAKGNLLDIDSIINSAFKNSYDIKNQNYSVQLAENAYDQSEEASNKANEVLIMNDDMIALKGKKDKTPLEQKIAENFKPLSEEQRYNLIKTRDLQPLEAKSKLTKAKNNKEVIENTLKLNIYTQYSGLLGVKDMMDTEEKKITNLSDIYNKSLLQVKLGMISNADANKNKTAYINEKPVLLKQQRQMEIAQMDMNKTIGEDLTKKYDGFTKEIFSDSTKIKSLDQYLADALKNRAEIINAEEDVKVKKSAYDLANKEYPNESERHNQQSKYDIAEAENKLETLKLTIEQEVTNSYNDLAKKAKSIEYAKKNFELAKKNYDDSVKRYELGMISKIELANKEISYKQAENNYKSLERDLWLNQLRMDYQSGKGIVSVQPLGGITNK